MDEREHLTRLLHPAHTALLTVECQRGVVGPGSALPQLAVAVRSDGTLGRIAELVAAARQAGASVVHAIAERRADGRGTNRNARLFRAAERLPVRQLEGTPAVEVADEITVDTPDFVVRRLHGLSPLGGTGLDALLRNLGVRTVVVTGVSLNIAVPSAVFDAVNLGYEAVVPADAVAGVPAEYAAAVLRHTLALVATVTTAEAVRDCWSRERRSGQLH